MTAKPNINSLLSPELLDAFGQHKLDIFRTMHCIKPGKIQIFDGSKKTAQVKILLKRVLGDGTIAEYPVLVDCPVVTIQGGGAALEFPIMAGDDCLLFFADRNIDVWFKNGSAAAPFDARCHDLSDGFALVGINSLASDLDDYEDGVAKIFYDGANISMSGGLVKISNNMTTLLTLLNGLIDTISAITVQDGSSTLPLTAAALAALTAYKLQLATLLE